jgi:DNA-binding phage protein
MPQHNDNKSSLLREKLIYQYVTALDEGDLDAIAPVLEAALEDPELEQAITEINLAYQEEEGIAPTADDARLVRELLRKHLTSAFETPVETSKPLTVGDVASRLRDESKLSPEDRHIVESLLDFTVELPASLGMPAVKKLGDELGIKASDRFWQAFRTKAIFMRMGRSHEKAQDQTQLAAAREAVARRNTRKKQNQTP